MWENVNGFWEIFLKTEIKNKSMFSIASEENKKNHIPAEIKEHM